MYIVASYQKLKQLRDSVSAYLAAGLSVCRLAVGEKNPTYPGWSRAGLNDPDLFDATDNVGLLCGWLSEPTPGLYLVGIDLDDLTTLARADQYLPATGMIEGRLSKPRSHRYYLVPVSTIAEQDVSPADQATEAARAAGKHYGPKKLQFRCPDRMLVEIIGTGGQLAAPPSAHPQGEVRSWEGGVMGTPAVVPWPDLLAAVTRLAVACGWGPKHPPACGVAGTTVAARSTTTLPPALPAEPGVPASERVRRARWYVEKVPGTTSGQGASGRLWSLARTLVHGFGLTAEEALRVLLPWGRREDQTDADGEHYPWTRRELEHTLVRAEAATDPAGRPLGWKLAGPQLSGEQRAMINNMWWSNKE